MRSLLRVLCPLALLFFATQLTPTSAAETPKNCPPALSASVKADAKEDPGKDAPKAKKFQLGRAKPKKAYDYGHFRAVVGQDGKTRFFARLSKHHDAANVKAGALPASTDWSVKAANVKARMYLNDQYGDCVIASRYHAVGFVTASATGTGIVGTDNEVYATYQAACGAGDNGCDMSAMNQYQQQTGMKFNGQVHKIASAVSVDNTNKALVQSAIYVFGNLNVGMDLPQAWYDSADGTDWDVTNTPIVGGHEVQAFGYDEKGVWVSTWAGTRRILWSAFLSSKWINEVYTALMPDWTTNANVAPNGIDAGTLAADLALIAGGTIPPLPDPNPPTPPNPIPPTPNPPAPGVGFSGTIAKVTPYVNGVPGQEITIVTPAGSAPIIDALGADLKAAGVSPAIIVDVLQLITDLRAQPRDPVKILSDIVKILTDFAGEPKVPDKMPERRDPVPIPTPKDKTGSREQEYGECVFVAAKKVPWFKMAARRNTGELVLLP